MKRPIASSPFVLGIAAALLLAASCSNDEDSGGNNGGTSSGGASGASSGTGASSGKGGTSTGGTSTGGTGKGGTSTGGTGKGGTSTGGTSGAAGGDEGGMAGVGGTDGGMGGEGGVVVQDDVLDNPGFELGDVGVLNTIPGWQESGDLDASYVEWTGGRNDSHKLGHWRVWIMTTQETYTTSTFQTVSPIANGTYTFSMWVNRKYALTEQYLFARGHNAADQNEEVRQDITVPDEAAYYQVSLNNIQVTSGHVTVGIHTASWGGDWSNIDDATLTKNP